MGSVRLRTGGPEPSAARCPPTARLTANSLSVGSRSNLQACASVRRRPDGTNAKAARPCGFPTCRSFKRPGAGEALSVNMMLAIIAGKTTPFFTRSSRMLDELLDACLASVCGRISKQRGLIVPASLSLDRREPIRVSQIEVMVSGWAMSGEALPISKQ